MKGIWLGVSLLLACHVAAAATVSASDASIVGNLQLSGMPQHQDCVSSPFRYESSFAYGAGTASTTLVTSGSDGCTPSSAGVYRTDFSLQAHSEAGITAFDEDGVAGATASGTAGPTFCNPSSCVGFDVLEPTVLDLVFAFDYELVASTDGTDGIHGYRGIRFLSTAAIGVGTSLCTYDERPFDCENQSFGTDIRCDSTTSPTGCSDSESGSESQVLQIFIDEPGTYIFSFDAFSFAEAHVAAARFIVEPASSAMFAFGLLSMLAVPRATKPRGRSRQRLETQGRRKVT